MPSANPQDLQYCCKTTYDWETKIWSGIKMAPLYGPECTLGGEILKSLLTDPEKIAQICHHNGKIYKNRDIARLSVSVAQHFKTLKIEQCDIVGIVSGNTDFLVPLVFGAWLSGLIICPMEPSIDKEIIKQAYNITKPKVVFAAGAVYEKVSDCLKELNIQAKIYLLNDFKRHVPEIAEFFQNTDDQFAFDFKPEPLKYGCDQTAVVLRSSGSTGTPKAVCASHVRLLNSYRPPSNPGDVYLSKTTISWISGVCRLLAFYFQGITYVINESGFSAAMIPEIMEKYKITFIFATPRFLASILEHFNEQNSYKFLSLRKLRTGGSNVPHALIEKAKIIMPNADFQITYGSSESNGAVTDGPLGQDKHSGQLVPNHEIKIVDDSGQNLGPNELGEICVRSVHRWMGYYKNPKLTETIYKNDWFHTSDLGYMDENGNLYVVERKNDIITYKEQTIYPNEIENIINELDDVIAVCVCGVPDDDAGHLPAAAVIKKPNSELSAEHVYDYVAARVSDEKNLRGGIYFTNFLPQTLTGKNLRFRCGNFCEKQRQLRLGELKM